MFRSLLIGLSACILILAASVGANPGDTNPGDEELRASMGPDEAILLPVEDVTWEAGPASLPEGAEYAVLEGDPTQSGLFVMRLRLPDQYVIPPHSHPNFERVTVMSGTFHLGHGETPDRDAMHPLRAGSFTSMPPGMVHHAFAEGETVIQLTSIGPWEIKYVNPADDPRQQ